MLESGSSTQAAKTTNERDGCVKEICSCVRMHYLERCVGTALKELPRQDDVLQTGSNNHNKQSGGKQRKRLRFRAKIGKLVKFPAPVVSLQRRSDGGDHRPWATVAATEEPLVRRARYEIGGDTQELKQTCRRSVTKASSEGRSQKMVF